MTVKHALDKLPPQAQQALRWVRAAVTPGILFKRIFSETYEFLQESQRWDSERLREYQVRRLGLLLHHAYGNVPYYRRIFDDRGLTPKDIGAVEDLQKLPFLTRKIIRDNLPDLVARNFPKRKLLYVTTGGTTGTPMGFYFENVRSAARERAFMTLQWERVGYRTGDRSVVIRGDVVETAEKGRFWRLDPASGNLIMPSFHMTEENLPIYIKKLRQFAPDFIQAFPSAAYVLAQYMHDREEGPFSTLKAVLCVSESMYDWQRSIIENTFGCRVYSWYGHSERAVLAGECEESAFYHIFPEYGITEIVDEERNVVLKEGKSGEIIATGFNNFAMPFIRYRTGDRAMREKGPCRCGRAYPLLTRIEGRVQEYIVAGDGSLIPFGPILFGIHDPGWGRVRAIQFVQEEKGALFIRVVKDPSCTEREIQRYVRGLFEKRLPGRWDMEVQTVPHIPRAESGKYRFLVQKISATP